jgi:poly-beta-hydroxyalkanoate depolymerase
MTTITLTEHMKKMLLNGTVTVSTTGNTYVHPLTTATTVPVASGSVSVSDDWQAFRNRVMRDMLDATAMQAVGKSSIPMTATAVLLDASLRKQLMNGAVFPGVIIASPEHPHPVELSAALAEEQRLSLRYVRQAPA